MMRDNKERNIRYGLFVIIGIFIVGLVSSYLQYRTGQYVVWNDLAYFEIAIIAAGGVFLFMLAGYLLIKTNPKYEIIFLGLVLAFGFLYMLAITPLSGPDEHYHYDEAYRVSNLLIFSEQPDLVYEDYLMLSPHNNTEGGYIKVLNDLGDAKPEEITLGNDGKRAKYIICYLPQAVGILIGRVLNRNFITLFILGRFTNLLFYACCVYIAIKNIPRFKVLLGIISMMPMALHQAASFSTDAFINGLSFVLIAYAFKMIWEENYIKNRDIVLTIVIGILLAPAKVIYCSIFLLFFLIPPTKFQTKKTKFIMLCGMIFFSGVLILLFQLPSILSLTGVSGPVLNWEQQKNYDVAFVLANPLQTVKIFWDSFVYWYETWLKQAVGSTLSGLNLLVDDNVISAYMFVVLFSIFDSPKTELNINWKVRVVNIVIVCSIVFLTMTSMFLGWTSNTRAIIQGVQGRYFIPALPLLAISLSIPKIRMQDKLMNCAILFASGLNLLIIAEVLRLTIYSIVAQ